MAQIAFLYNKRNGEIVRSERLSDQRARNANIYNLAPRGVDTLELKLKVLPDDRLQPLFITNINDIDDFGIGGRTSEIACIFHGGLGDAVVSRGLIEGLKRMHGRIIIDAHSFKSTELFELYPEIRKASTLSPRVDSKQFAKKLSLDYEAVYDFRIPCSARFERGRFAYAKSAEIYEAYPDNLDTIHRKFPHQHILQIRAESVGLKWQIDDIDVSEKVNIQGTGNPYCVISGYSRSKIKMWHGWEEIVENLNGFKVVQLGVPEAHHIEGTIDKRGVPIQEVIDIIGGASLLLDCDSGLTHLARSVGTKSVVVFGPTSEKNWGYRENANIIGRHRCPHRPCFGKEEWGSCEGDCMNAIPVEQVLKPGKMPLDELLNREHGRKRRNRRDEVSHLPKKETTSPQGVSVQIIPADVEHVLILADIKGLGDVKSRVAAIQSLRKQRPNVKKLGYLGPAGIVDILENHPDVDYILTSDKESPVQEIPEDAFVANLKDTAGRWEGIISTGSPSRGEIYTRALGLKWTSEKPRLYLSDEEKQWGASFVAGDDKDKIGVALRTAEPWKDWPHIADFIELAKERYSIYVFDKDLSVGGCVNVTGYPIRNVMAILPYMDMIISPDTALHHLAEALECPCLALFGSMPIKRYLNRGYDCSVNYLQGECVHGKSPCMYILCEGKGNYQPCMDNITPEFVLEKVKTKIERGII